MVDVNLFGFYFAIDNDSLYLSNDLLTVDTAKNDLNKAVAFAKENRCAIVAGGKLYALAEQLKAAMKSLDNGNGLPFNTVSTIRYHTKTEEGKAQVELWCSYFYSCSVVSILPEDDLYDITGLLDTCEKVLDRFDEFMRYVSLSNKFIDARHGYVYLFRLSSGHYKIGLSNNPRRRGREITSGLPFTLEIIHQIPSNQIACLEHELHEQFKDKRHGTTEWFELHDSDVAAIKSITGRTYPWIDNPEWGEEFKAKSTFFNMRPLGSMVSSSS